MNPELNAIRQGDVLSVLKSWPDSFVQSVVTSPPYWGLRDYSIAGQIGLEKSPAKYIENLVKVFREVRRVLKKDGTLWLNLGDTYSAGGMGGNQGRTELFGGAAPGYKEALPSTDGRRQRKPPEGFKPKDLLGIPWRVAIALQEDGWWLRSDIIWNKPNPMPESVVDRPTKSHEYIFLMAKSIKYFYDAEAIKEPIKDAALMRHLMQGDKVPSGWNTGTDRSREADLVGRFGKDKPGKQGVAHLNDRDHKNGARRTKQFDPSQGGGGESFPGHSGFIKEDGTPIGGVMANKRSVWTIPTQGFKDAHFATFPEDLIAPCIKAGSRPGDIVLDPFMGAGTTAVVAKRFKRNWLGIELNEKYIEIAQRRISVEQEPLLVE